MSSRDLLTLELLSSRPSILLRQCVNGDGPDEHIIMDRNMDGDNSATGPADQGLYYEQDRLGNVAALRLDTYTPGYYHGTGYILEGYVYDPYGHMVALTVPAPTYTPGYGWYTTHSVCFCSSDTIADPQYGNPYTYTGQRLDTETGLLYYKARYYDPDAGRFLSRDPIGIWGDPSSGGNGYAYAGNSPMRFRDPSGLSANSAVPASIGGGRRSEQAGKFLSDDSPLSISAAKQNARAPCAFTREVYNEDRRRSDYGGTHLICTGVDVFCTSSTACGPCFGQKIFSGQRKEQLCDPDDTCAAGFVGGSGNALGYFLLGEAHGEGGILPGGLATARASVEAGHDVGLAIKTGSPREACKGAVESTFVGLSILVLLA